MKLHFTIVPLGRKKGSTFLAEPGMTHSVEGKQLKICDNQLWLDGSPIATIGHYGGEFWIKSGTALKGFNSLTIDYE